MILAFIFLYEEHGNATCTFGSIDSGLLNYSTTYGLIVNTATTAQCPGSATAWNLCYYYANPTMNPEIYLGVYRLSSGSSYSLVPGSSKGYNAPQAPTFSPCKQTYIALSQQFVVQTGDVIAACLVMTSLIGGSTSRVGIIGTPSGTAQIQVNNGITCGSLSPALPSNINLTTQGGFSAMSIMLQVSLSMSS